jgi:hypothetical protein
MPYVQESIMTDQLIKRIENLEKQNKRMKVIVLGLCLCLGTLLTMGQALPQKTGTGMERIEAREIVLIDGDKSAILTPQSLTFSAKSGREAEKATIAASEFSLGGRFSTVIRPEGMICSRDGVPRYDLVVREIGASIAFKNDKGLMGSMLDESTMVLMNSGAMLSVHPEHVFLQKGDADALLTPTSLKIRDEEKFKAIIGYADRAKTSGKAGARAKSAASLTLVGKDDTVLWRAP